MKRSFEQRFRDKLAEYEQAYDLSSVNSANDKDNLRALITNAIIIEDLHDILRDMSDNREFDPANIEKTTQLIQKLLTTNQQLERQLGIDRKTRRASGSDSLPEYIAALQDAAKQFVERRLTKVICPNCHVMVGRFAPVHDHTRYVVAFQCSQCNKMVSVDRNERSVWFDLKPREYKWRKNYPVSIRSPKSRRSAPAQSVDDLTDSDLADNDEIGNAEGADEYGADRADIPSGGYEMIDDPTLVIDDRPREL